MLVPTLQSHHRSAIDLTHGAFACDVSNSVAPLTDPHAKGEEQSEHAPDGGYKHPVGESCEALVERLNDMTTRYKGRAWCTSAISTIPEFVNTVEAWLEDMEYGRVIKPQGEPKAKLISKEHALLTMFTYVWSHIRIMEDQLRAAAVWDDCVLHVHLPQELKDYILVMVLQE